MEYNFENKFVETDETIIFFDNYINVDIPKEKFVIINHLSADNLAYFWINNGYSESIRKNL